MLRSKYPLAVVTLLLILSGLAVAKQAIEPANEPGTVLAFYYPWHGNPEFDGEYRHWNHEVVRGTEQFPGGNDIGANFYPELGCYSNNDPEVVALHMRQMSEAGVDVVVTSWWGAGSFEDDAMPLLLDTAHEHGLGVSIHLEPYYEDIGEVRSALQYIHEQYSVHPAFHLDPGSNLPLVFAYDSYRLSWAAWATLLDPVGDLSIRGTELDAMIVGLWVNPTDGERLLQNGFDGAYSYFAVDGYRYGCTPDNWQIIDAWAANNNQLFIPCVAPGYCDERIRPWNAANTRSREDGAYYDRMWQAALATAPTYIGITSFNEWHEGTQIEPAVPRQLDGFTYRDYAPLGSDYYLQRTAHWTQVYRDIRQGIINPDKFRVSVRPDVLEHKAYGCAVELLNPASPLYPAGERGTKLTDGLFGGTSCRDGHWVGFEGTTCDLLVVFDSPREVSKVRLRFLVEPESWVFPPMNVTCNLDTELTDTAIEDARQAWAGGRDAHIIEYVLTCNMPQIVSEIHLAADNAGACPFWHNGAGGETWLFVDEVIIE